MMVLALLAALAAVLWLELPSIVQAGSRRLVAVYLLLLFLAAAIGFVLVLPGRTPTLTDVTNAVFAPWRSWMTPPSR